jgi:hypothetical protein
MALTIILKHTDYNASLYATIITLLLLLPFLFPNIFLSTLSSSKRDEVKGGWRKLHNEELRNLYSSPIITRKIK